MYAIALHYHNVLHFLQAILSARLSAEQPAVQRIVLKKVSLNHHTIDKSAVTLL